MTRERALREVIETWRPVVGLEGRYEISDFGGIRSAVTGVPVKTFVSSKGYHRVNVGGTKISVHRLVLLAFVGPCPPRHEGAHLNGIRTDNTLRNLAWVSRQENHLHKRYYRGADNVRAKLGDEKVDSIRRKYATGTVTLRQLAEEFSVHQRTIWRVVRNEAWMNGELWMDDVDKVNAERWRQYVLQALHEIRDSLRIIAERLPERRTE